MSEQKAIDKAQESVDHIVRQLCGYNIPCTTISCKFLESVLNYNGFCETRIDIDIISNNKPVVIYTREKTEKDLF